MVQQVRNFIKIARMVQQVRKEKKAQGEWMVYRSY